MPYAKSKPRANQKRYSKKSYKSVTPYTVAKIARSVVRKQNPTKEYRFIQTKNLNSSALANSFNHDKATLIAQGVAENQRIGDEIFLCGIKVRFAVSNPHTADRHLRLMVVQDRNQAGQLLDTTDWDNLFSYNNEADTVATGLITDVNYPINSQYKVYADRHYTLQCDGRSSVVKDLWIPIMRKVHYDDLGSTTSLESGEVYVILHMSEMGTATSTVLSPSSMFCRVFYKDA